MPELFILVARGMAEKDFSSWSLDAYDQLQQMLSQQPTQDLIDAIIYTIFHNSTMVEVFDRMVGIPINKHRVPKDQCPSVVSTPSRLTPFGKVKAYNVSTVSLFHRNSLIFRVTSTNKKGKIVHIVKAAIMEGVGGTTRQVQLKDVRCSCKGEKKSLFLCPHSFSALQAWGASLGEAEPSISLVDVQSISMQLSGFPRDSLVDIVKRMVFETHFGCELENDFKHALQLKLGDKGSMWEEGLNNVQPLHVVMSVDRSTVNFVHRVKRWEDALEEAKDKMSSAIDEAQEDWDAAKEGCECSRQCDCRYSGWREYDSDDSDCGCLIECKCTDGLTDPDILPRFNPATYVDSSGSFDFLAQWDACFNDYAWASGNQFMALDLTLTALTSILKSIPATWRNAAPWGKQLEQLCSTVKLLITGIVKASDPIVLEQQPTNLVPRVMGAPNQYLRLFSLTTMLSCFGPKPALMLLLLDEASKPGQKHLNTMIIETLNKSSPADKLNASMMLLDRLPGGTKKPIAVLELCASALKDMQADGTPASESVVEKLLGMATSGHEARDNIEVMATLIKAGLPLTASQQGAVAQAISRHVKTGLLDVPTFLSAIKIVFQDLNQPGALEETCKGFTPVKKPADCKTMLEILLCHGASVLWGLPGVGRAILDMMTPLRFYFDPHNTGRNLATLMEGQANTVYFNLNEPDAVSFLNMLAQALPASGQLLKTDFARRNALTLMMKLMIFQGITAIRLTTILDTAAAYDKQVGSSVTPETSYLNVVFRDLTTIPPHRTNRTHRKEIVEALAMREEPGCVPVLEKAIEALFKASTDTVSIDEAVNMTKGIWVAAHQQKRLSGTILFRPAIKFLRGFKPANDSPNYLGMVERERLLQESLQGAVAVFEGLQYRLERVVVPIMEVLRSNGQVAEADALKTKAALAVRIIVQNMASITFQPT